MSDTLASYFAERARARGFQTEVPPGGELLARASDVFLSKVDAQQAKLACIVDCDGGGRRFALRLDEVRAAARAVAGRRAAFVEVFEIGAARDRDRRRRLGALRARPHLGGVDVVAWTFDARTGTLWTNAPLWGIARGRPFFREVVDGYRRLRPRR